MSESYPVLMSLGKPTTKQLKSRRGLTFIQRNLGYDNVTIYDLFQHEKSGAYLVRTTHQVRFSRPDIQKYPVPQRVEWTTQERAGGGYYTGDTLKAVLHRTHKET